MKTVLYYGELIEGAIITWAVVGGIIGGLVTIGGTLAGNIVSILWFPAGIIVGGIYGGISSLGVSLMNWIYLGVYRRAEPRLHKPESTPQPEAKSDITPPPTT